MSRERERRAAALVGLAFVTLAGCGGKKDAEINPASISADKSFAAAMDLLAKHQLRQATTALKRIEFAEDLGGEIEPLTRLALADATFYQDTAIAWIDARNLYLSFVTMNGDHALAPYAQLQVGLCSLKQVSAPSKDQGLTRQAIRDLEAVEKRWPASPYVVASRAMLRDARARMAESEFLIGSFYLSKKNYSAAIERFKVILMRFPDYTEVDKILYHLASANVSNGNESIARTYLDRLASSYPASTYVGQARKQFGSLDAAFRNEPGSGLDADPSE